MPSQDALFGCGESEGRYLWIMTTKARLPRSARDARRTGIVQKASELFLSKGFAATSMSTVACAVGGSKGTLYKYFRSKDELFAAVLEERSNALFEPMHSEIFPHDTPLAFLSAVGERLLTGIYDPEAVSLYRVIIGDSWQNPQIGSVFFDLGPDRAKRIVASRLSLFEQQGFVQLADPANAAEDFLALLRGETHFRILAGIKPSPGQAEIRAHVQRVVAIAQRLWSF